MHSRGPFEFAEKQSDCYKGLVDEVYVLPRSLSAFTVPRSAVSALGTLINSKVRVPLS